MSFLFNFALKNLGRHRRRTIITASALAIGLGVFLLTDSMLQGADSESEHNLIWYEYGGARVSSVEAAADYKKLSLKSPMTNPDAVVASLKSAGLEAVPRLAFEAELTAQGEETTESRVVKALGVAVDDVKVFPRKDLKLQGRWFNVGEQSTVLGAWLAEDLGVVVGQPITLTTRTREGSYQVLDLEVVGLVTSADPAVNRYGVYLPLDTAQTQLVMEGMATEVAVGMLPGTDVGPFVAKVKKALPAGQSLGVLSWRDLASDYLALTGSKQKSSSMILVLVFVIAAVGVGNTLLLAFYERKTEIGMLRALGMPDKQLFWMFLIEAAGIGVVGSVMGLIFGGLLVAWLVFGGIDMSGMIRQMDIGYRLGGMWYGIWVPRSFIISAVLGVLLAVLSAIGPTRRALRLPITESLRAEG